MSFERLIREHDEIDLAARRLEAAGAPAGGLDFEAAFEALRCDWRAYLADWDAECIAADWAGFQTETAAVMARLRERVRAETDLIYPVALKRGMIALRDRRG